MERLSRLENTEAPIPQEANEKELAALSYVWVFSLVILLAKRGNPFIQHHARRGTVLFFLSLILWPFYLLNYAEFLLLALGLFGFIQAATGNENHTPVLSEVADGTLKRKDVRHYLEKAKEGAAKAVDPDFVPTAPKVEAPAQPVSEIPVPVPGAAELDERKLSALNHRLSEDENELHRLEDEVRQLKEKVEKGK